MVLYHHITCYRVFIFEALMAVSFTFLVILIQIPKSETRLQL